MANPTITFDKIVEQGQGRSAKWVAVVKVDGREYWTTLIADGLGATKQGRPIEMKQIPFPRRAAND